MMDLAMEILAYVITTFLIGGIILYVIQKNIDIVFEEKMFVNKMKVDVYRKYFDYINEINLKCETVIRSMQVQDEEEQFADEEPLDRIKEICAKCGALNIYYDTYKKILDEKSDGFLENKHKELVEILDEYNRNEADTYNRIEGIVAEINRKVADSIF